MTAEPVTRSQGDPFKVAIGIVHYKLERTALLEPSQFVKSYVNVLPFDYIIAIWYAVIGEPLLFGAVQLKITLFPLIVVTGG